MPRRSTNRRSPRRKPEANSPIREFWSGTISFGLVSVPVQMLPASHPQRLAMRQIDEDGTPLARRFVCPEENRLVAAREIVKGYEYEKGRYVTVTDRELEALEPTKSREIDLQRFVKRDALSPLLFDRSYYLTPDGDTNKAYRLLAAVLEQTKLAGIATFVMRDREYLVAIVGDAGVLRAETLRFADEVRSPADVGLAEHAKPGAKLVARYDKAIAALEERQLDPRELEDEYARRFLALVDRKRTQGKDIVESEEPTRADEEETERVDVEDLLDTIRRSLTAHVGNGRHNGSHRHNGNGRIRLTHANGHASKPRASTRGRTKPTRTSRGRK